MRNITFKLEKTEKDIFVWIDPLQMQKVFYNLISNAFKFTSFQGSVTIKVLESDKDVSVSVTDSGIGISPEHIDKIFDRFYQVDNGMQVSDMTLGTGIGLALSKMIVDAHSGHISVTSTPGVQSCFTVSILKGKEHFDVSEIHNDADIKQDCDCIGQLSQSDMDFIVDIVHENDMSDKEKPSILIVEDNPELRFMLRDVFSSVYSVILAVDGIDGLEKVNEWHPDIVLSDVMMPRLSGFDMCQKIKSNLDTCHIPVVLLTARTTIESNIEGLKNGADDYITKPFNIRTLVVRCNNLINNRRILQDKFSKHPDSSAKVLATNEQDMAFIERVCAVIEKYIDDPEFDVPTLCSELNMGRTKLFSKMKGISAQTPNDFILNIRLKKASFYLREKPDMSIADITYALGFSSPKYFSKCFKDQFGVAPTIYRKETH